MSTTLVMKFPPLKSYGVDVPRSERRTLRDLLVEAKAQEAAAIAATPAGLPPVSFWSNIIRWRVAHVRRLGNIRDLYDAMWIRATR